MIGSTRTSIENDAQNKEQGIEPNQRHNANNNATDRDGLLVRGSPRPAAATAADDPLTVTLTVNGKQVAQGIIERSVPAAHTASETFDVGKDLGSPVALDYYDRAPFRFNGKIEKIHVRYFL